MQLKPEELAGNGYRLLDELNHQDIMPFIRRCLKYKTKAVWAYWAANLLALSLLIVCFWWYHTLGTIKIGDGFSHFSFGIALAFALIPLHEFIHVLAYRYVGAQQTSYDANIKKFYFMAMADRFVASEQEFRIVALAPFVSISLVLLGLTFLLPATWDLTLLGTLLTHTAFCSGDFGLLSYFEEHRKMEIVTYDDKTGGMTYFYGKENR